MEDLSELTDLTQQLNEKLVFRIEQVRSDMARLQGEKAEFEAEKEVMQCLTSQESDIIKLNVRGKLMETRRSTLCQALKEDEVQEYIISMRKLHAGRKIMLGVDRLDRIKGIPQKLLAFEKFLEDNKKWME